MGLAKEHKLQQEIDVLELADEQNLREQAIALGFTDFYGSIEYGGHGLSGTINGRVQLVKSYINNFKP